MASIGLLSKTEEFVVRASLLCRTGYSRISFTATKSRSPKGKKFWDLAPMVHGLDSIYHHHAEGWLLCFPNQTMMGRSERSNGGECSVCLCVRNPGDQGKYPFDYVTTPLHCSARSTVITTAFNSTDLTGTSAQEGRQEDQGTRYPTVRDTKHSAVQYTVLDSGS